MINKVTFSLEKYSLSLPLSFWPDMSDFPCPVATSMGLQVGGSPASTHTKVRGPQTPTFLLGTSEPGRCWQTARNPKRSNKPD